MNKIPNIIYKAVNKKRKCFYVGYAVYGLENRQSSHKKACFKQKINTKFYNFIRKYGWDSFNWDIMTICSTREELPLVERKILAEEKERFPNWECLNMTDAGDGLLNPSPETLEKMRNSHLGKKATIETLKKLSNFQKGRPKSEDHKRKIGESHKKENLSEEIIEKYRQAQLGKHPSKESIEKFKKWAEEYYKTNDGPFTGKRHTAESNEKNRLSHLGKYKGEKSPSAKLNDKQVIQILNYLKEGELSQSQIAKKFDISKSTINKINRKKLWKHLNGEIK